MATVVNIDHHHDNTGFGTINLLDFDASSTAEIVWDLVRRLGVPLTQPIAEALYVGLVTDTGRFSYENTTPRAHQMAAELLEAGIDVTAIRRRLYEDIGPGKLHLLRFALDSFVLHGGGSVISARITAADFDAAGATDAQSEGIIDVIRGVRGVRVAALARELEQRPGSFKVSLRAADPTIDVSAIARVAGGGGHPRRRDSSRGCRMRRSPSSCSPSSPARMPPSARTDGPTPATTIARALDGILLVDKPAGPSSHALVAAIRRAVGKGTKVGHAGTLDPFASGLMIILVGRGTRASQFLLGLDKRYETLAQLGARSTTGDPEGEIEHTGRIPASPLALPTGSVRQRPPAYSAIKIDGERAYKRARRGEEVEVPERTITVHEFTELGRDDAEQRVRLALHCSSGTYVRSLVADLGDAYCLELRRTAIGPFSIDDARPIDGLESVASVTDALLPLDRALAFLPRLVLGPEEAESIRCGRRIPVDELPGEAPPQHEPLLLCDEAGVIAVGRSDGARVATVVGFRA